MTVTFECWSAWHLLSNQGVNPAIRPTVLRGGLDRLEFDTRQSAVIVLEPFDLFAHSPDTRSARARGIPAPTKDSELSEARDLVEQHVRVFNERALPNAPSLARPDVRPMD
jgi:hypothetical protein